MASAYLSRWEKFRAIVLAVFILLFIGGVFILMNTGEKIAPMQVDTSKGSGDFGQYLADHYELLSPFFDKNRQDLITQGEPLLIKIMGDVILINMGICWLLAASIAYGFSIHYAPSHARPPEAILFATYRLGLDIGVFLMASFAALGWELIGIPISVGFLLPLFVLLEVVVQSFLVVNIYKTTSGVATGFAFVLLVIMALSVAVISGPTIQKRMAILLSQFVDVPGLTADLKAATAEGNRKLQLDMAERDTTAKSVADAKAKVDDLHQQEDAVAKDIETKKNSEAYVYGRIIRIRALGDLAAARDQLTAFMAKFPNGTLLGTAQAQLALVNQEMTDQETQKKQTETDAASAAAKARADLQAQASRGEVPLIEMRHALLGKKPDEVKSLFGPPTQISSGRWDYANKMLINTQTNQKSGMTIFFVEGTVQSINYF